MNESIVKWLFMLAVVICITAITIATVHALAPMHGTYFCESTDASASTSAFVCHN